VPFKNELISSIEDLNLTRVKLSPRQKMKTRHLQICKISLMKLLWAIFLQENAKFIRLQTQNEKEDLFDKKQQNKVYIGLLLLHFFWNRSL